MHRVRAIKTLLTSKTVSGTIWPLGNSSCGRTGSLPKTQRRVSGMARLLTMQRRLFLFVTAVIFTFIIRIVSMSVGSSLREGRSSVIVSDRGQFKQVAFRISKLYSKSAMSQPFKLGFHEGEASISYLLRIANFFPFCHDRESWPLRTRRSLGGSLRHRDACPIIV